MKIYVDNSSNFYSLSSKKLGNCITINDNKNDYFYEFLIDDNKAKIKTNNDDFLAEAIDYFHNKNKYISSYFYDEKLVKKYDQIHTFKLPIKCICPSKFFIDHDKLEYFDEYFNKENVYLPVTIINDEYVLIDGHTRLYSMYQNYEKLVNVYMDLSPSYISDFVYIAKEQNISDISKINLLSSDEYDKYWNGFLNSYFDNI